MVMVMVKHRDNRNGFIKDFDSYLKSNIDGKYLLHGRNTSFK